MSLVLKLRTWRRALGIVALGLALAAAAPTDSDEAPVEVIEVRGIIDHATLDYLTGALEEAVGRRQLVILQIDSPAVVADFEHLAKTADLIANPPLPLVAWIGPAPARAGGGAIQLASLAPLVAAAPEAVVENWQPAVVGSDQDLAAAPSDLDDPTLIAEPIPGLIDMVAPSIRQLLQGLDGEQILVSGEQVTLQTLIETEGGVTNVPVSFRQPGLIHRFFHLASTPEAAFFFLVAGLTVAAFEFYALGPGIAAAVAALSLLLGWYGIVTLPTRPWAVALTLGAIGLLTVGFQQGGVVAFTILGTAALTFGGLNFVGGAPQIDVGTVGVGAAVLAVLFFYLLAMPTVGRARFSTPTLGREHLIGRIGRAHGALTPTGVVEVDGGKWPATSHREANIAVGDPVRVVGVNGWQLEVDRDREN